MSRPRGGAPVAGGCCKDWSALDDPRRSQWEWQSLHELAHSRIPFSTARYADIAHLSADEAERNVQSAGSRGWIRRAPNEHAPHGAAPLWQGALTKRR